MTEWHVFFFSISKVVAKFYLREINTALNKTFSSQEQMKYLLC